MHFLDSDSIVVLLVAAYLSARLIAGAWEKVSSRKELKPRATVTPLRPRAREMQLMRRPRAK